jgi:hypothetical protein
VIKTVGGVVGGADVGNAAEVWAAWVKTSPGSGVSSVLGRLQADRVSARRVVIDRVSEIDGFISLSLTLFMDDLLEFVCNSFCLVIMT